MRALPPAVTSRRRRRRASGGRPVSSPPFPSPPAPPGAGRGLGAAGARPGAAGASAWGMGTVGGEGGRRSAGGEEVVVPARRPLAGSGSPGRRTGPAVGRWQQQRAWAGAAAGTKDRAGGGRRGPAVASPRQGGRECMSPASQLPPPARNPPCPRAEVRAHGRPGEGAAVPGQGRCEAERCRPSAPQLGLPCLGFFPRTAGSNAPLLPRALPRLITFAEGFRSTA